LGLRVANVLGIFECAIISRKFFVKYLLGGGRLLAVGLWLLAVGLWLLAFGCWLLAFSCWQDGI
jgi:phosphoglycerol transferase MdoB-like AlkP superfamily enzyme